MGRENSKIQIPNVGREYVERPLDMLLVSLQERVVILHAGAGYGKTQVLANYVSRCSDKSAWYSLSETDNDLMSFVRNLTGAVELALGGIRETFQVSVSPREDLDILVERLVIWLDERAERLNIILDDFQEIQNPDIFNLLEVLMETMDENIRFFIADRRSLPSFLEFCAREGTAVCLETEEFQFKKPEIMTLLKPVIQDGRLEQEAELVYSCTEGWPVGVAQIILQMRGQRERITFDTVKRLCEKLEATDYFMTRVYQMLPFDIQLFLKKTAVLDYMTVPVCNRIMDSYNSENLLKYLVKENLFVQSVGEKSGLYRYHSIFQRFLLTQIPVQEQMDSLRKAAFFFLKTDDKIQAAEYGCRGKSVDVVQAVIEVAGERILEERLYDTIKRWFLFLQKQNCELTPRSRFVYGKYLWMLGRTEEAKEQILTAGKSFYEQGRIRDCRKVLLFAAASERKAGNLRQAELYLQQAEDEGEMRWDDMAEAGCMERIKYECCLHHPEEVYRILCLWLDRGARFEENLFLLAAQRIFGAGREKAEPGVRLSGLEDGFLLQNYVLAEHLKKAYQEGDGRSVLRDAQDIIRNAEYETVHTSIAWKMLALLSWNEGNYRKAVEQASAGDEFLFRNQIQLQDFEEKHRVILDSIRSLQNGTADTRYVLLQKTDAEKEEKKETKKEEAGSGKIRIQCMKNFSVILPGEERKEIKWRTKKAQELFAYLFHLQGEYVSREELTALLWPENGGKSATALFHTTIYSIRQAFIQEGRETLILYEKRKYSLNMEMISSDLEELTDFFREYKRKPENPEQVMQLYPGGYMEDTGYLWAYGTAKKLEDEYLCVCRTGARQRMSEKKEILAVPFWQRMLEREPYDEEIVESLIVCLYSSGKKTEAKQQYDRMVQLYREDLELDFEKTFQEMVGR